MHRLFPIFLFLLPIYASGDGHTITLASGLTVEPYIIRDKDAGFEADIVKAAFAKEGFEVEFVYQPLHRTRVTFQQQLVDGVLTVKAEYPEVAETFLSDDYINYKNYAITLTANEYIIQSIEDLKPFNMVGFQQAHLALGEAFNQVASDNPLYTELTNQKAQVDQLFVERTDVIIIDIRIFTYYRNRLTTSPKNQPVTLHRLFDTSDYKIAFREEKHRDAFNRGLKEIQGSGLYDQIIDSYLSNPNL